MSKFIASMSSQFWPVLHVAPFVAFLAILTTVVWTVVDVLRSRTRPPGPFPLPVIGNLHQLLGRPPHQALFTLSQRFGPLMFLRLGCVPALVVSSAETAKEFLQTHEQVFSSRPKYDVAQHLTYNYLDIIWAPYGQHWRDLRKICTLELFSSKRVDSFQRVRREETTSALASVYESAMESESVNLRAVLSNITLYGILRMATSHSLTMTNAETATRETIEHAVELVGALNVGDYLPYLKWLDLQGYGRRAKALHQLQDTFFQSLIDKKRQEEKPYLEPDLLDVLLSLQKKNGLTDNMIKAVIQDMVAAGSDTAWVTCEWAIAELLNNPSAMQKLQAELDTVVGRERSVDESDLPRLGFLQSVVKETLRLHPASPLILYESIMPCVSTSGYKVERGTRLLVNVYAISRDPKLWERPLEFYPERFEKNSVDLRGQHFQLIPFGSGRRICPGMNLGLRMVHYILARMLQEFNWEAVEVVKFEEKFGLTMPKLDPLSARARPRLRPGFYVR